MNRELERVNTQNYSNDEIDLYEIVEILVKNKMTIGITFILSVFLSLGGAYYIKNSTPDYLVKNLIIREFNNNNNIVVNKIEPRSMFLLNGRIDSFFEIKGLEELYKKQDIKTDNYKNKRKFLESLINIKNNKENYTVEVKLLEDKKLSNKILNKFIENLNIMDTLPEVLNEETLNAKNEVKVLNEELKKISKEIGGLFSENKKILTLKPEEQIAYLNYRYPDQALKKEEIEKYYNYYSERVLELNRLKNSNKLVQVTSSVYEIEGKSKAKLVVVVGIFLGLFLGIMMAFLKEFVDGYKRRYSR